MKIVSWNCNGAFRKKYQNILELDADILVIQECESIYSMQGELKQITSNGIWEKGVNKNGVLVISKPEVKLKKIEWNSFGMKVFIPIMINDLFPLIAVWTTKPAYIEEFYIWQSVHSDRITDECVIIGDFNSNAIWDKEHRERGHSAVVNILKGKGLQSAYHFVSGDNQGEETKSTFHMYRNAERRYHIDHCFVKPDMILSYKVLEEKRWLELSDHFPIMLELKEKEEKPIWR